MRGGFKTRAEPAAEYHDGSFDSLLSIYMCARNSLEYNNKVIYTYF
jgi:hypothetical protein